ncbi:MAG TPA: hypothetical protein VGG28_24980 [Kofleriaceae bacterium]
MIARVLVVALIVHSRPAGAFASSCRNDGWGTAPNATLPVHPRVTFYADRGWTIARSAHVTATIDNRDVPIAVTFAAAPPFDIATIEIKSDRTGTLRLTVEGAGPLEHAQVAYTIAAHAMPAHVHGTASRFHRSYHHTSVHESWDGLAVAVDATVIAFSAKWRRDAQSAWSTLIVPGTTLDDPDILHLGEISCVENFAVTWLERGIDLELTAELPDGTWLPVEGLPSHVVLAPLPAGTDVSTP